MFDGSMIGVCSVFETIEPRIALAKQKLLVHRCVTARYRLLCDHQRFVITPGLLKRLNIKLLKRLSIN